MSLSLWVLLGLLPNALYAQSGRELVRKQLPFLYNAVVEYSDDSGVVDAVFEGWTATEVKYLKKLNQRILEKTIGAKSANHLRSYRELMRMEPGFLKSNFGETFGMRKLKDLSSLFPASIVMSGSSLDHSNIAPSLPDGLLYSITGDNKLLIHLSLEAKTGEKKAEITTQLRRLVEVLYGLSLANESFVFRVFDENGRHREFNIADIYFSPFERSPLAITKLLPSRGLPVEVIDEYFRRVVFEVSRSKEIKTMFGEKIPLDKTQLMNIGISVVYSLRERAGEIFANPHKSDINQFLKKKKIKNPNKKKLRQMQDGCRKVFE